MSNLYQRRWRCTIMSGRVVTFAKTFEACKGIFGTDWIARGWFEVSASRDYVMVHRCTFSTAEDAAEFTQVLIDAYSEQQHLLRFDDPSQEVRIEQQTAESELKSPGAAVME